MSFGEAVVASIVAVVIAGVGRRLWRRRSKVIKAFTTVRNLPGSRRHARQDATHAKLVEHVRSRAGVLHEDVPEAVTGRNPARVIFYPSGRSEYYFEDHLTYRRAVESRSAPYDRSFGPSHHRPIPTPVHRWSDNDLRAWLRDHRHRQPG